MQVVRQVAGAVGVLLTDQQIAQVEHIAAGRLGCDIEIADRVACWRSCCALVTEGPDEGV